MCWPLLLYSRELWSSELDNEWRKGALSQTNQRNKTPAARCHIAGFCVRFRQSARPTETRSSLYIHDTRTEQRRQTETAFVTWSPIAPPHTLHTVIDHYRPPPKGWHPEMSPTQQNDKENAGKCRFWAVSDDWGDADASATHNHILKWFYENIMTYNSCACIS